MNGPLETRLLAALDDRWRSLRSLGLVDNTKFLIKPAQTLVKRGLVQTRLGSNYNLEYRRASVDRSPEGQDAQRLDAEHESAVTAKPADAQPEGPLP